MKHKAVDLRKVCGFDILPILSCGHLKKSRCGERLSLKSPYLPLLEEELRCNKSPSLEFHLLGRLALISLEETRGHHHTQTDFVTNYHTHHLFF